MNKDFAVCILSAGKGIRMGVLTENINKSLLPVNNRAVISHIIEKFSHDVKIVIAVGYEAEKVKQYVRHAHSDRDVEFVEVDNYDGPGSGPGYSLFCCREELQQPFIIYAADTLVDEPIPEPNKNWVGVSNVDDTIRFCAVDVGGHGDEAGVTGLKDKSREGPGLAFIGIAGVNDYTEFWSALEGDKTLTGGEIQVSNGLNGLMGSSLQPELFETWRDTGTVESYEKTRTELEPAGSFNFEKVNEYIFFADDKVIKYFSNPEKIQKRYARWEVLKDLCPEIFNVSDWFYSYKKVKGNTLYEQLSPGVAGNFFSWSTQFLWEKPAKEVKHAEFYEACHKFYIEKTKSRLSDFFKKYDGVLQDETRVINGVECKPVLELFDDENLHMLLLPSKDDVEKYARRIHGDLQFDNILKTGWDIAGKNSFKLLDWREDFGGLISTGDLHYDLAKLYGGLTISYASIKDGNFSLEDSNKGDVKYDFSTTNMLNECMSAFEKIFFDQKKMGDVRDKVMLLRPIIFLNMSPLHHEPFDRMLYYMGQYYLNDIAKDLKLC